MNYAISLGKLPSLERQLGEAENQLPRNPWPLTEVDQVTKAIKDPFALVIQRGEIRNLLTEPGIPPGRSFPKSRPQGDQWASMWASMSLDEILEPPQTCHPHPVRYLLSRAQRSSYAAIFL